MLKQLSVGWLFCWWLSVATAQTITVGDGDSITIDGIHWRLWGIDAPELAQLCQRKDNGDDVPCGEYAKDALVALIVTPLDCHLRTTDSYQRRVGICINANGDSINKAMVQNGWAVAYRRYSHDTFIAAEQAAIDNHRGIWQYHFIKPEKWRRQHPRR